MAGYGRGVDRQGILIALAGDVMTGRGVDQVLPSPGDPQLWEGHLTDARDYVRLAERAHGPIPRPVGPAYPWGDALAALDEAAPDLRIINLETSVTAAGTPQVDKPVLYRMHPGNLACLTAAGVDACALGNNHVLDFGVDGLEDTLEALGSAGLAAVGAGHDRDEAWRPLTLPVPGGRVLLWSIGTPSSGVPLRWAATTDRPGVAVVADLSARVADEVGERVRRAKRPGDVAVVSIHWGSNWGYAVPRDQASFAHRLVEHGVDLVHGHSSHHPRPVEVHGDRLVLHGCGDFINDYEGISGYERYRGDLRLLHLVRVDPGSGRLLDLRMVPFRSRRLRLERASEADTAWLGRTVDRISRRYGGVRVDVAGDELVLR